MKFISSSDSIEFPVLCCACNEKIILNNFTNTYICLSCFKFIHTECVNSHTIHEFSLSCEHIYSNISQEIYSLSKIKPEEQNVINGTLCTKILKRFLHIHYLACFQCKPFENMSFKNAVLPANSKIYVSKELNQINIVNLQTFEIIFSMPLGLYERNLMGSVEFCNGCLLIYNPQFHLRKMDAFYTCLNNQNGLMYYEIATPLFFHKKAYIVNMGNKAVYMIPEEGMNFEKYITKHNKWVAVPKVDYDDWKILFAQAFNDRYIFCVPCDKTIHKLDILDEDKGWEKLSIHFPYAINKLIYLAI